MTSQARPAISSRAVWTVLLNASALVLVVLALWKLRAIVSWVLIALLLALALQPAMAWLTRHGFKRGWAVLTLFLVIASVLFTMTATLVPMIADQGRDLVARAPDLIERIEESRPVKWVDRRFQVLDRVQTALRDGAGGVAAPALAVATGVLHGLAGGVTVVTLTVFMLLFGDEVVAKALEWLPPGRRQRWNELSRRMRRVVGGYVAGTMLVASVGGIVMGTTLAVLGVPYFLPLGLVMVVLGIIPFLGSALGAVLLVGITFASSGARAGLICAGVYLVYQQVENEVLQPVVQRRTLRMNPLFITLALLAGTGLAGILGTLLALPVAGAVQVVLEELLQRRRARFAATGAGAAVDGASDDGVPELVRPGDAGRPMPPPH